MKMRLLMLVMLAVCSCAFALPTPTTYISFEDTTFGGATYIDDQMATSMDGTVSKPVAGAINIINGTDGVANMGSYGQFVNNGWWLRGGDSLAVAAPTTGSGTIAMWARMDVAAVKQTYPLLWDSAPEGCTQGWKAYTTFANNGVIENFTLYSRVNNNAWVAPSTSVPVKEQWFHYALTWSDTGNGTADLVLYINGVAVSTQPGKTLSALDSVIRIGGGGLSLGHTKWQGDMDEVYVFDTALTGAEVAQLQIIPEPTTIALLCLGGIFLRNRKG